MSSADPTDAVSPKDILSKSPRAKARLGSEPAVAASEDADVRSEKPQQPRPEERKTDPKKPEADQPAEQGPKGIVGAFRKHPITMIVCFGLIVIGVVAGVVWYLHARHYESTDDAFIDGRPVLVSPEVGGSIVSVDVTDNQIVKKGDLLATIDRRNYQAALQQANGLVAQNEATATNIDAQITAQKATIEQAGQQVTQAQAALKFSTDENNRYQDLMQKGAGTVQRAQQASSDLTSKQAALEAATAAKLAAERQIDVLDAQKIGASAQLEQAEAQRDRAIADLQRTELRATVDGRVTKLTAAVGALAAPGQSIMVVVPLDIWVTANFKESQLAEMRVGQPVDIEVDAFGRTFPGHVDSVQAGSGTAFSLLPAENATGNYVKVVQRVPVKIVVDNWPADLPVGPGMSVVPWIRVR
jgi:membrane fusion protein, multidrug efflux system